MPILKRRMRALTIGIFLTVLECVPSVRAQDPFPPMKVAGLRVGVSYSNLRLDISGNSSVLLNGAEAHLEIAFSDRLGAKASETCFI